MATGVIMDHVAGTTAWTGCNVAKSRREKNTWRRFRGWIRENCVAINHVVVPKFGFKLG